MRLLLVAIVALEIGVVAGCSELVTGSSEFVPLELTAIAPSPVLPGTQLFLEGGGFVDSDDATLSVRLYGDVDGIPVDVSVVPYRVSDQTLQIDMVGPLADELFGQPPVDGTFVGAFDIIRDSPKAGTDVASLGVVLELVTSLTPSLTAIAPKVWFPGDKLILQGSSFIQPSEGTCLVQIDGVFTVASPPSVVAINGLVIPATPPSVLQRNTLQFVLTPDIFGIRPGTFSGVVTVINSHLDGTVGSSEPLELNDIPYEKPMISEVSPRRASRGQRILFQGRGLLSPDSLLQATSLLLLEGRFQPKRGAAIDLTGTQSLALFPDPSDSNLQVAVTLRVEVGVDGEPYGLGATSGRFDGAVTPMLLSGPDTIRGDPFPLEIEVEAPRQLVYVHVLPAFEEALEVFGLMAAHDDVLLQMLAAAQQPYEGINVAFTLSPPSDYAEYGTVEVGGWDPNGTGLFGLDNTAGKDVGNMRFDDVIGGFNAETRSQGFAAHGGIFPAEFLQLSPTLSESSQTSLRFDAIFATFSPELGGQPASAEEVGGQGARQQALAEAVRVFGNLIGNTIAHEVGHSLGLTAIDGQFHNSGDNPAWIMDAGSFRPFEERGQVDGAGPEVFSPTNRTYLEQVLPLE